MYVCRVTLAMEDLHVHGHPHAWMLEAVRMGMALGGDGLLQEVKLLDSSEDEDSLGRAGWTRPCLQKLLRTQELKVKEVGNFLSHHQQWTVRSQLMYIFIFNYQHGKFHVLYNDL